MLAKVSRCQAVRLFSAVLVSWVGSTVAAQVQREPGQLETAKEAATSEKAVRREPWHLVRIPDPLARRATIAALESASAQFADADCRKIFTDFDDGNGRSLADRLSAVAVDIHVYLTMVTFIDDTRHRSCASGVLVFTAPGSRVVRVCADELKRINAQQHDYVVASLIHEILHTLGLRENPPSSREITARVLARCGGK
jgi:nitroreductase